MNVARPNTRSTTRYRHRMICNDCLKSGGSKRFTLKKHPDDYKRTVRCPRCKGFNVRSDEATRRREYEKRVTRGGTCQCSAYPFRHQKGSLRFCGANPRCDEPGTDQEIQDHADLWEVDRSGSG